MARQYGFFINTDRCIQCHACEVACKSWHGIEAGIRWRRVVDFWQGQFPAVANQTISFSCMHCEKPACADICPEGAVSKRAQDGIVVVDQSRCSGCRSCETACPYHVPQYGRDGTMQKCHMCLDRLEQNKQPSCVITCPGEALKFGPIEEFAEMPGTKAPARLEGETIPSFFVSGRLTGATFLTLFKSTQ
jgi:anaerobic dimethyl sulfoxide reductase subunit B (iron-sulfur subunit)